MYNKHATKVANLLTSLAGSNSMENKDTDIQVIIYGIELLLSSFVNLILVMIVGGYFFGILPTLVFILFFCPIRQFSGGFHAKSYMTCTIGFLVLYFVLGNGMSFVRNEWICFGTWIVLGGLVFVISPIDTENKRLDKQLKSECKKKIGLILCIELVVMIVFFGLGKLHFLQMAVTALCAECILLVLGWFVNQKE